MLTAFINRHNVPIISRIEQSYTPSIVAFEIIFDAMFGIICLVRGEMHPMLAAKRLLAS